MSHKSTYNRLRKITLKSLLLLLLFFFTNNIFSQDSITNNTIKKRPKIGLVLSGGGAKGFAHIGVLKIIDKLGIPIDYIAGTSMGSIIGGLYSIGYTAEQIEQFVIEKNWDQVLSDNVSREYVPIYEKDYYERYILSIPIKPKGIQFPKGIVQGQNIINIFEELTTDYHKESNFREFPIPFVCIATDLESGKPVVLDKGYLADALRASMAIPTFFSPIEIDGKLLADGGMVNNFPVKEVVDMGADIVIGVDVQSGPKTKRELNSFIDIINQTVTLMSLNEFKRNIDYVDIYIKPDIGEYSVGSFSNAKELIEQGEKKAIENIDIFKNLKNKYQFNYKREETIKHPDERKFLIKEITANENKKIRHSIIRGKFNSKLPDSLDFKHIRKSINRIYGSNSFKQVDFRLLGENQDSLNIRLVEKPNKHLNIGLHYDSDNDAAVLFNFSIRNKLRYGSKWSTDIRLAENPRIKTNYYIDNGLKPGFKLSAEYTDSQVYGYEDGEKVTSYDFDYAKAEIQMNSTFRESYSLGLGIKTEYFRAQNRFSDQIEEESAEDDIFYSYFASLHIDNHEKSYHPKTGFSFYGEYKLFTNDGITLDGMEKPASSAYCKIHKAVGLTDKFTVYPQFYGRVVWGTSIPLFYESHTGGVDQTDYFDSQLPFIGLERMEISSRNSLILRLDLQYEIFKNNFLSLKSNIGLINDDINEPFNNKDIISGIGLTYSYASIIGPLDISLLYSGEQDRLTNYISLGFWF
ncbi:MAG: patatin-like phospholipase family protein [Marinifilaceae bacterium]|jgi:NTE family protein|nr:patatin-like phospholipase family protein [Marinifilaceae bacterium]